MPFVRESPSGPNGPFVPNDLPSVAQFPAADETTPAGAAQNVGSSENGVNLKAGQRSVLVKYDVNARQTPGVGVQVTWSIYHRTSVAGVPPGAFAPLTSIVVDATTDGNVSASLAFIHHLSPDTDVTAEYALHAAPLVNGVVVKGRAGSLELSGY